MRLTKGWWTLNALPQSCSRNVVGLASRKLMPDWILRMESLYRLLCLCRSNVACVPFGLRFAVHDTDYRHPGSHIAHIRVKVRMLAGAFVLSGNWRYVDTIRYSLYSIQCCDRLRAQYIRPGLGDFLGYYGDLSIEWVATRCVRNKKSHLKRWIGVCDHLSTRFRSLRRL